MESTAPAASAKAKAKAGWDSEPPGYLGCPGCPPPAQPAPASRRVAAQMWRGSRCRCGFGRGADVARVPVPMWLRSRRRCGAGRGADVAQVAAQMWRGEPSPRADVAPVAAQMWRGSRRRCGPLGPAAWTCATKSRRGRCACSAAPRRTCVGTGPVCIHGVLCCTVRAALCCNGQHARTDEQLSKFRVAL